MIDSIWVRNFCCYDSGDHHVSLGPLTILVGPNNAGKSTMITGFNLLRTVLLTATVYWTSGSYNLGDFNSAVYGHSPSVIELGADVSRESRPVKVSTSIDGEHNYRGASYRPQSLADEALEVLKSCWYFRASRSEVSRAAQVQPAAASEPWRQMLDPSGSNVISFLLERWTDQDPKWSEAQDWLKKIDPELSILKTPLKGNIASLVTTNKYSNFDVNLASQGTGVQKALAVMAAVIFSPKGATIIVEEPEVHLHKDSQEVLADLFNYAVNNMGKQVIFTTHSWDMLLPYISDVCKDQRKRGQQHVKIDPSLVGVQEFSRMEGNIKIQAYPLQDKIFKDAATHFGQLLG